MTSIRMADLLSDLILAPLFTESCEEIARVVIEDEK